MNEITKSINRNIDWYSMRNHWDPSLVELLTSVLAHKAELEQTIENIEAEINQTRRLIERQEQQNAILRQSLQQYSSKSEHWKGSYKQHFYTDRHEQGFVIADAALKAVEELNG